jgi:hypothetical protein
MTAAYRSKTKMCPLLETQYTQNPRVDKSIKPYTPGKGFGCTIYPGGYIPQPVPYILSVIVMDDVIVEYGGYAIWGASTIEQWAYFSTAYFEKLGNDPVVYGILNGLTSVETGIYYANGVSIPARSGTFTANTTP